MNITNFEFWEVVVKPGETVKCDPGEIYCHISQITLQAGKGKDEDVRVFVKVDGKEILIGTLSVDKHPRFAIDLVFEKEFELLHTSKTSNIYSIGYKFSERERKSDTCTEEDDESDEEVPLAIPLYSNADDDKSKETKNGAEKFAALKPAAAQSSKPKVTSEETKNPGKLKADVDESEEGESGDDEDSSDEDESVAEDVTPTTGQGKRRRAPIKDKGKKAKTTGGQWMQEQFAHIVELSEKNSASCESLAKREDTSGCAIKDVMVLVKECGANPGTAEHFIATQVFTKRAEREMFMTLETPEDRFQWLKMKYQWLTRNDIAK